MPRTRPVVDCSSDPSRTKQSFLEEADINNIMRKYINTGVLPVGDRKPTYGDFSSGAEYQDLQNQLIQAQQEFELLPADIRDRFGNSPEAMIDFLSDPENEAEAIAIGLIADPDAADPDPDPVPDPEPGNNDEDDDGDDD